MQTFLERSESARGKDGRSRSNSKTSIADIPISNDTLIEINNSLASLHRRMQEINKELPYSRENTREQELEWVNERLDAVIQAELYLIKSKAHTKNALRRLSADSSSGEDPHEQDSECEDKLFDPLSLYAEHEKTIAEKKAIYTNHLGNLVHLRAMELKQLLARANKAVERAKSFEAITKASESLSQINEIVSQFSERNYAGNMNIAHIAALRGSKGLLEFAINKQVALFAKDSYGQTAQTYAFNKPQLLLMILSTFPNLTDVRHPSGILITKYLADNNNQTLLEHKESHAICSDYVNVASLMNKEFFNSMLITFIEYEKGVRKLKDDVIASAKSVSFNHNGLSSEISEDHLTYQIYSSMIAIDEMTKPYQDAIKAFFFSARMPDFASLFAEQENGSLPRHEEVMQKIDALRSKFIIHDDPYANIANKAKDRLNIFTARQTMRFIAFCEMLQQRIESATKRFPNLDMNVFLHKMINQARVNYAKQKLDHILAFCKRAYARSLEHDSIKFRDAFKAQINNTLTQNSRLEAFKAYQTLLTTIGGMKTVHTKAAFEEHFLDILYITEILSFTERKLLVNKLRADMDALEASKRPKSEIIDVQTVEAAISAQMQLDDQETVAISDLSELEIVYLSNLDEDDLIDEFDDESHYDAEIQLFTADEPSDVEPHAHSAKYLPIAAASDCSTTSVSSSSIPSVLSLPSSPTLFSAQSSPFSPLVRRHRSCETLPVTANGPDEAAKRLALKRTFTSSF